MPALPILVDTDMALDDWMAIALLRASPRADLRAITIAATGEAHARPGVNNALRLLALVDDPVHAGPVDVAAGRETPLGVPRAFPWLVRQLMDWRFFFFWPAPKQAASTSSAVAVLRDQLRSSATPVTILAIGPLTNLAELLTAHPDVKPKIARVVSMGGALDVDGNLREMLKTKNTTAEWNIYIDPTAANVVFSSGVPVSLVPLDATNQLPLTDAFFARLSTTTATPAGKLVHGIVRRIRPLMKNNPFCFWDPVTAILALRPELGTWRQRRVVVVEGDSDEAGRVKDDAAGAAIDVCVAVDRAGFEDAFVAALNGALD